MPLSIAAAQGLWEPAGTYLNTASFGLPPRPAWDALQAALDDWRTGRTSWEHWGKATDAARASFARLIHVEPSTVAVGATVSGLVGLVASSLPDGSRVLAPGDRVHLDAVSVPRRGATRRHGAHGAGRRAGRGGRRDDRPRRLQRGADGDRRGRRPRRDRGRRPCARSPDAGRRDAGLRLAAARRHRVRHRRRRRVQVAPLAARHRLHGGRAVAPRRNRPDGSRLVCRRGRPRVVLRSARCAWRPTPAGSTPHLPGTAGSGLPPHWL